MCRLDEISDETKRFIAGYLNPKEELIANDLLSLVRPHDFIRSGNYWELLQQDISGLQESFIAYGIKSLAYPDFLRTPYWQIIRSFVLSRDGAACTQCKSKRDVDVHHKTYEHHGFEHIFTDDLIALCRKCHALEHGKLVEAVLAWWKEDYRYSGWFSARFKQ